MEHFEEKYLKRDNRHADLSFAEYCLRIPKFLFKPQVPEDVLKNFEVIEHLMALSYFEYRLVDEANSKSLSTFEMAMNIRCLELGLSDRNATFPKLITKLSKNNYFETPYNTLKILNRMRDHYSHPKHHSFAGTFLWSRIEWVSYLINELYDDIELRLQRQNLFNSFLKHQQKLDLENYVRLNDEDLSLFLYKMSIAFVDNKESVPHYHFACIPAFDLKQRDENEILVPMGLRCVLRNVAFAEESILGEDINTGRTITFATAKGTLSRTEAAWANEYEAKRNKFQYEASLSNVFNEVRNEAYKALLRK